jgi:tetratricopeptide (TPR) repeat protein
VVSSDIIKENMWKPDLDTWEKIKEKTKEKFANIAVIGIKEEEPNVIIAGTCLSIKTSKDRVDAPIFFRSVPLPFSYALENLYTIKWRFGDISSEETPPVLLENIYVCGNCHSFTRDGTKLGMDIDYGNDKGSYVVSSIEKQIDLTLDKIFTWSDYRRDDGELTFGLLSQISPDGRYVLSTVKDRSIFVPIDDLYYSQLFFPIKGIICVYDTKTGEFWSLPGANDKAYCQSNPCWSPDGKEILFAKAPVFHSPEAEKSKMTVLPISVAKVFIDGEQEFKYDICRIPFNNGKGGTAVPIKGASNNGMSNYFGRYSPDGKWIVYTQADNFMLLQPDSKLYIIPAEGGTPRKMNCNTNEMNSWHSFSPNSKWLVFSSKVNSAYTQLLLTHIDENGIDSPPVLLEHFVVPERAANIPEFLNIRYDKLEKITERFMESDNYIGISAIKKITEGNIEGAIADFNKAIQIDPLEMRHYLNRGALYAKKNKLYNALADFSKVIEIVPNEIDGYFSRGTIYLMLGNNEKAAADFTKAIQIDSNDHDSFLNRGNVRMKLNDFSGAIEDFNRTIELQPESYIPYLFRGITKNKMGLVDEGCADLQEANRMSNGAAQVRNAIEKHCLNN